MKLGTETGSLVNHLFSRMTGGEPGPTVGTAATLLGWTDRHAATVIGFDGKTLRVQRDSATRTDRNGFSESQDYTYDRNPNGTVFSFRKGKNGRWREVITGPTGRMIFRSGGGYGLRLGVREEYWDPCF